MEKTKPKQKGSKLTLRQQRFCEEYIVDGNGAGAARRAGYSEKSARERGCNLLTKPYIQEYLEVLREAQSKRTEITADKVLQELALIGFSDIGALFDRDGDLKRIADMPEHARRALAGFDITTVVDNNGNNITTHKVKPADKLKALELLGKTLKLFTDRHELVAAVLQVDAPAQLSYDDWEAKVQERLTALAPALPVVEAGIER